MAGILRKVAVVATPTSPLLKHLLHALEHTKFDTTVLTRPTSISVISHSHHDHGTHSHQGHTHANKISHQTTDFTSSSLTSALKGQNILISLLTGSDIHQTPNLIDAATKVKISRFVPSEYGLDSANPAIRSLLPPYQTRWSFQEQLQKQDQLSWTALYAGNVLEEGMKPDGVLGVDLLWGSVSTFGTREVGGKREVVLTTFADLAKAIVKVIELEDDEEAWRKIQGEGIYVSSFVTNFEEIVDVVEKVEGKDRKYDWYEVDGELARKEAKHRMEKGYFDGGVALLTRVAVWDEEVDAMGAWKREGMAWNDLLGLNGGKSLEEVLTAVVNDVKDGNTGNDCGC